MGFLHFINSIIPAHDAQVANSCFVKDEGRSCLRLFTKSRDKRIFLQMGFVLVSRSEAGERLLFTAVAVNNLYSR